MNEPRLFHYRNSIPIEAAVAPGTDEVVHGNSSGSTMLAWEQRCAELGLKFDNPLATFHDCACRALSDSQRAYRCAIVNEESPAIIRQNRLWDFESVNRFLKTVWSWIGCQKMVDQEEAERRARICAVCPMNQPAAGIGSCAACRQLATEMFEWIGKRTTANSNSLQTCSVCGCQNAVAIWVPLDVLAQYPTVEPLPSWCWKNG